MKSENYKKREKQDLKKYYLVSKKETKDVQLRRFQKEKYSRHIKYVA